MSKDYHAEALKGTRETALSTVPIILKELERYGNSGHKDARKHQIIYTLNVLTSICRNCEALREAAHYDIYVDIFTQVLVPKLDPQASPSHWKRLLSTLEYLFLTLADFSMYAEAYKLHTYFSKIQLKWQDTEDFKLLLSIHGSHLQMLIKRQQKNTSAESSIKDRIIETLRALEKLFVNMSSQCREKPTDCTALLSPFINKIITKSTSIQMQLASTLQCEQMECVYKKFFELISVNSKFVSSDDPSSKFQEHIQALYYFFQMDMHSKLKQQVALQYARILRNIAIFAANGSIKYCSEILYHLLKLTYARVHDGNFKETYSLLCTKFCRLLTQSGKGVIQQLWFQDIVVFVCFLFHHMQKSISNAFDAFWQQMDASLYILEIKLLAELVKITPLITKLNLIQFSCCKNPNTWFHIQLIYNLIGLETYTQMLKHCSEGNSKETDAQCLSSVKTEISTFLQQSIDTLIQMENECTKSAVSIRKLCVTFAKLLQQSNQYTLAPDLFSLATDMTRLKSRILPDDWLMIMSRVNKNVLKCKDANLATDILSCYIAELICYPTYADVMALHRLILYHHSGTPRTCLYEIYINLTSPFKPLLQKNEKRYFHWLEAQYVHKFYDKEKDFAIFTIMAQRSQTKYDFINAVHAGKLLNQSSMFSKVQNIYDALLNKKRNGQKVESTALTRLEELTLAHSISLLLSKRLQEQKAEMSNKDFLETNIPQLLQEKSLRSLSVTKEQEKIDMAREAVKAFEAFFNRADLEPLPTSEGSFIDWERILEDLTSLASYFQLTGYLDDALEAWLLQYRIANTVDDIQSSLRSLAFFCEYNYFFEKDTRLQLSNELKCKNSTLIHVCENLKQLTTRQQNFTLICVCQIAYYHASKKQLEKAEYLLQLVKHLHKNKLDRQDTYDIVLFTADVVFFRILWKLVSKKDSEEMLKGDHNLLHEIDIITERLRTYVNKSSADMRSYTILFLNSIDEFAEYVAIHMCDNFLSGHLSSALRLCVEGGFAIRTVQVLSKWILINLQMENLQKAEIKMQCVECILDLRDFKELQSLQPVKSCAMTASKQLQNGYENGMCLIDSDAVRKVAIVSTPFPIKSKNNDITSMALDYKLENCLEQKENNEKTSRLSHVVLWSRFILSCLRARFNFLSSEYKELEIFYENCEKWLEKRWHTIHFQINQSTVLFCMLYHANFLRANRNYEKALKYLKKYIDHCATLEGKLDEAYLINFKLQFQDTKLEQIENKTRKLPIKKKIDFFESINSNELKLTPATKPIKYTSLAMTSYKKPLSSSSTLQTAGFVIYSDRKSPRKAQVTLTKPMPAMKTLTFSQNSSESGSGSEKENLDKCQVIEISDSDCDFDVDIDIDKPKAAVNISKPKKQKPKFKFLESIDFEDFETPKIDKTPKKKSIKSSKKIQKVEKSKDELSILIDEMQNVEIESRSSSSSSSKTGRTRRRSPNIAKKINKTPVLPTPCIEIDSIEDSPPVLSNAAATRSTRQRSAKQSKSKSPETVPETTTNGKRRLPVRQARLENITPTTTLSSRRRHRN